MANLFDNTSLASVNWGNLGQQALGAASGLIGTSQPQQQQTTRSAWGNPQRATGNQTQQAQVAVKLFSLALGFIIGLANPALGAFAGSAANMLLQPKATQQPQGRVVPQLKRW